MLIVDHFDLRYVLNMKRKTIECRAKDVSTCRYHKNLQNIPTLHAIPEASEPAISKAPELWEEALHPQPVFRKPRWARDKSHKHMEAIAEIKTDEGHFIVMWESQSQDPRDLPLYDERGIRIARIGLHDYKTGERVGRITASYMDKESLKHAYGDDEFSILRFREELAGDMAPESVTSNLNPTEEEKVQIYRDIVDQNRRYNYWRHNDKPKIEDMTDEEIKAEAMSTIEDWHINEYKRTVRNFHHPFVDYSKIEDERIVGKGYGTFMYLHMARMLGKDDKVLRGSGIQSPEAQKVWSRLVKTYPTLVKTTVIGTDDPDEEAKFVLDIRK